MKNFYFYLCGLALLSGSVTRSCAEELKAFSLREANRLLAAGQSRNEELQTLGGITRFAGMVLDREKQDIILIGKVRVDLPPASIDDLAVALRCRLLRGGCPRVSIDMVEETARTGMQNVRFDGGIDRTAFGSNFLGSDVILKRYSLGLLEEIGGLDPYLKLYENATKTRLAKEGKAVDQTIWLSEAESKKAVERFAGKAVAEETTVQSRFWFHVKEDESFIVEKDDVYVIEELRLGVKTETLLHQNGNDAGNEAGPKRDIVGEEFSRQFTERYQAAAEEYPLLQHLKTLFDFVCIAEGIANLGEARPDIDFLLLQYKVRSAETPEKYPLVQRVGEFRSQGDVSAVVQLSGGIDLEAILLALEDGDVNGLKMVVRQSRPGDHALSWTLPLSDWQMPNDNPPEQPPQSGSRKGEKRNPPKDLGFALTVQRYVFDSTSTAGAARKFEGFAPLPAAKPTPVPALKAKTGRVADCPERFFQQIGGVMLQDVARVSGGGEVGTNIVSGNFCLVVNGKNAQLDQNVFRKFITALWTVYFEKENPGISIDPIAPGVDKHLVRYIGKVINTDLGRVMREADYSMKKWAVGTEWPDIPGFRDIDSLSARHGVNYVGASRRLWLVPADLRFKEGGGLLLFDGGRMTVQTEYVFQDKTAKAEPADQAFADFFTSNYSQIAAKYPVYEDLFEYAKMVSLAKYLKEKGVPLFWYLMANKDLVHH